MVSLIAIEEAVNYPSNDTFEINYSYFPQTLAYPGRSSKRIETPLLSPAEWLSLGSILTAGMDGEVSSGALRSLKASWPSPLREAHGESRARSWEGTAEQHACVLFGCALPGTFARTPDDARLISVYPRGSPAKNAFLSVLHRFPGKTAIQRWTDRP